MNYVQEIIAALTSLFTTGSATITSPAETQTFEVAGEKFEATEQATVTLKKV